MTFGSTRAAFLRKSGDSSLHYLDKLQEINVSLHVKISVRERKTGTVGLGAMFSQEDEEVKFAERESQGMLELEEQCMVEVAANQPIKYYKYEPASSREMEPSSDEFQMRYMQHLSRESSESLLVTPKKERKSVPEDKLDMLMRDLLHRSSEDKWISAPVQHVRSKTQNTILRKDSIFQGLSTTTQSQLSQTP